MKKILSFILCAAILAVMLPLSFQAKAAGADGMLDEIIIKFFDKSQFAGKEKQYDDEVAKVLKDGLSVVTDNVYVVKAADLSKNPNAVLNRYKNSQFIEYVEPNYTADFEAAPNDPNYTTLKALLTALNAQAGWDIVTGGGPIVAVVDSGVAVHPDLPGLLPGYSAVAGLSPNNDTMGHGTGVAGTIGALGNNGLGTVGMNWNASILPVKVDDASGVLSVANIAKGIIWAADNGAKIINLSLGTATDSVTLKNAIDYAYNKGCAIFAATGNDGKNSIYYPARYADVMAVGATGNATTRDPISSYGTGMGVVAITSYNTTTATKGYQNMSGTSFSSPQVAGLASLILALNPKLTNEDVYSYIQQGAKPLLGGYNIETGYGVIDMGNTLRLVKGNTTPPKIDTTAPVLTLQGSLSMELKQGAAFVEPGYTAIDDTDGNITSKVSVTVSVNGAVTGAVNTNVPGVYRLEYKVADAAGNTSSATRVVSVAAVDNTPPVLTLIGAQNMQIAQGQSYAEPGYTAFDATDGDLTSKVTVNGSVNANVSGTYTLTYTVSDAAGNIATASRSVLVAATVNDTEPANVNPPANLPDGLQSLLLAAPAGTRNDYTGSVGYEFECLADMTVSYLGRPLNGAMNDTHRVYIWQTSTQMLVAYADITPDSPLDKAGFKVAALDTPVTLQKGEKYRIVSSETSGGDKWYDVRDTEVMQLSGDFRFTTSAYTYQGGQNVYPSSTYDPTGIRGHVGATLYYTLNAEVPQEPAAPPPQPAPVYKTPPVITLNGAAETTLLVNDVYNEAGYSAADCNGADLTGAVKVTSNVNVWTPGIYTINYSVEDAGGNTARATRTVDVAEPDVPPPPANAPTLTIIGSNPIILHLDSGTPYTEQGATAYDEVDGDISNQVQIIGNVNRNQAGTYTLTYKVVNSAGLEATATRDVRILAPDEVTSPRQTYDFSGQGKAVSTITHKDIVADDSGYMDFSVTSLDKNMTIKVEVKNRGTGVVVFSNTYTGAGGTQFWADAGTYDINVTIAAGNGNSKYGVRIVTPETIYLTFTDAEVPLSDPILIRHLISTGDTPLEICLMFEFPPEALDEYYNDFIAAGWTEDDLAWFGLATVLNQGDTPLSELPPSADKTTYIVVSGDSLWKISQKLYGTGLRWYSIYDMNADLIGKIPGNIAPGMVLTVPAE